MCLVFCSIFTVWVLVFCSIFTVWVLCMQQRNSCNIGKNLQVDCLFQVPKIFSLIVCFECNVHAVYLTVTNWGARKPRCISEGTESEDPHWWQGGPGAPVDGGTAQVSQCRVWPATTSQQCQIHFSHKRKLLALAVLFSVWVWVWGGDGLRAFDSFTVGWEISPFFSFF